MRRSGCRAGGTSLEHERTEQRRVERGQQRRRLLLRAVEDAARAGALAEVEDDRAEVDAGLEGRALDGVGDDPGGVERRPAPRERAFANGEPASVEPVAELPVAVDSERDPGDREREQQSSWPEPADDQRPGCEDEWNGDGADDSPRARRGRMALERRVQPCLPIEL